METMSTSHAHKLNICDFDLVGHGLRMRLIQVNARHRVSPGRAWRCEGRCGTYKRFEPLRHHMHPHINILKFIENIENIEHILKILTNIENNENTENMNIKTK